ncbi:MAG: hypothetical protein QE487_06755 [Fluviicola sp.]|nr:hypothetical protein [Fluviicola sp.]
MYNAQFTQVLEAEDLYGGEPNYADLRFLYKRIIDSIKHISVLEGNTEYIVQLTNVDEDFVRSQVEGYLEINDDEIGEYSKEEIINTVSSNTARINQSITKDIKLIVDIYTSMGKEPVFAMAQVSIAELRKRNLVE